MFSCYIDMILSNSDSAKAGNFGIISTATLKELHPFFEIFTGFKVRLRLK